MLTWINLNSKMHHIAYMLMKKPNSAARKKHQRSKDVTRSTSPADSEQALQDREEITKLKIENERLKSSLECRENEVGTLKDEVQRLEEDLNSTMENSMILDDQETNESSALVSVENGTVEQEASCQRNLGQEVAMVRDGLASLRECFDSTDPHQHTIDTVEQTVTSLAERLAQAQKHLQGHAGSLLNRRNSFSMGSGDIGSYISSSIGLQLDTSNSYTNRPSTKLVYYTNKSSTPFVSVIHKRLGEITLRDLKSCLDRPGLFRYHFKTLDPDYGMVKEEVVHDEDIVPGWDDRIVAWIEKADD